jgi:predicted O-linked N-acetylglucosamine transferase (SPINDLY family)
MTPLRPPVQELSALDIARQGLALHRADRFEEAQRAYRRALALAPAMLDVWTNLGAVGMARDDAGTALRMSNRALRLRPGHPLALNNLGLALMGLGRVDEAAATLEALLHVSPDDARATHNLGTVRQRQGDEGAAIAEYEYAVAIDPDHVDARLCLGAALRQINALTRAIGHFRTVVERQPDKAAAWADLANTLALAGRHAQAREALFADVDWTTEPENCSLRLFTLNMMADVPAVDIAREHREAGQRLEASVPRTKRPAAEPIAEPIAGRRLRIGYVSPDLRIHPVGRFLLPLFEQHDHDRVEVFCYADVPHPDALTGMFRARASAWLDAVGLSHADLAARIAADRIDVLVDLAGHTANHRLPVFARQPAPVQVSWLGYSNTTGLSSIGYRITDAIADPPGLSDTLHSERLVRLDTGFLCFAPPAPAPPLAPPPMLTNGYVTFGSFNALGKLNPAVIALWCRVLAAVPGARLILKAGGLADAPSRRRLGAALRAAGAPAGSVTLVPGLADYGDHLASYRFIDIALDPFPYNGTTTTCEALWMGVPVVTLAGDRHAGRVGASLLTRVGLDRLVARDEEAYVIAARWLASDRARLAALRGGMRERLARSPLTDARRFAAEMEAACRWMAAQP